MLNYSVILEILSRSIETYNNNIIYSQEITLTLINHIGIMQQNDFFAPHV